MSDNPFPVKTSIFEDESGLGYCLRAAVENGGSLLSLHHLLGIDPLERIKADHAIHLSQWFCVEKSDLEKRLPVYLINKGGIKRECYGHLFRHAAAFRSTKPQVCTECIFEDGYLKDVWDLNLSTCCTKHKLLLVGKCQICNSIIKWNRKGVQWGSCRHHLVDVSTKNNANRELLQAQNILQAAFQSEKYVNLVEEAGFPEFLARLSVDGWMQLFFAFGILRSEWNVLPPGSWLHCLNPSEAQNLVNRGFCRLKDFLSKNKYSTTNWSAIVARAPLVNLMIIPTSKNDISIGCDFFLKIFGSVEMKQIVRKYPQIGQLDLFSDFSI